MEPFKIPESLKSLTDTYPHPKVLLEAARSGGERARVAFAQLWLSEGIPHAFGNCPAVYEAVRCWLSDQLEIHAKEISLVGSARLGYSLAPKKFGVPFDSKSDLDLFIVSTNLFERLKEDFYRWSADFESGEIKPLYTKEKKWWPANYNQVPKNIQQGFIDTTKIPNYEAYPVAQKVNDIMSSLINKLKIIPNAPKPRKASVRCYSSWDSFVQQQSLNLALLLDKDSQDTNEIN